MYSSKDNVNILTALLVAHGVRHAVVCPGSRNAPIVHNLNECPQITCHPVTDERSAGFYALGMAQATDEPVVVCVTSGSALLNVLPAVAEASYQHHSLIVVSADRPPQWIDQLDGQTLPQPGALGCFVTKTVTLPEPHNEEERWYCNRLVNEALLEAHRDSHPCVHINVPISEPLFDFTVSVLPAERKIDRVVPLTDYDTLRPDIVEGLSQAERPMIVIGQTSSHDFSKQGLDTLFGHVIVLHESLAPFSHVSHFDEVLHACGADDSLLPDFVLYAGGTLVSKRLKHFLRRAKDATVWRIGTTDQVEDTFMNLRGYIVGDAEFVLQALDRKLALRHLHGRDYRRRWLQLLSEASRKAAQFEPAYSQMAAVKCLEEQLASTEQTVHTHYANSTAIRLANIYASHHVWCNRGVNGIEGSLSTAAGFSVVTDERVVCVTGDLSFFYDQNALWNQNLRGNLRILLLNNGRGGIFNLLRGLEKSAARDRLVAAEHHATAEGILPSDCYRQVAKASELQSAIDWLLRSESASPLLVEVLTDAADDERVFKEYYSR